MAREFQARNGASIDRLLPGEVPPEETLDPFPAVLRGGAVEAELNGSDGAEFRKGCSVRTEIAVAGVPVNGDVVRDCTLLERGAKPLGRAPETAIATAVYRYDGTDAVELVCLLRHLAIEDGNRAYWRPGRDEQRKAPAHAESANA